jgi:hypothetical protein
MKNTVLAAAVITSIAVAFPALADETQKFSLGTGVFYSTGKYGGTQSTDILYVPVTGKYQSNGWTLKLTVPYLRITGPGNVLNGVGLTGNPNAPARSTQSGLGDVIAAVSRKVYDGGASGFMVNLTGKIKLGTADSTKGLGTGQNDYALQTDLSQSTGNLTTFGSIGYKVYGSPAAYTLNNVFYGSLGVDYKFNHETNGGALLTMRQKALATGFAHREALLFLNHKFDKSWKAQGYILKGFTNGSPSLGAGGSIDYLF